MLLHPAVLPDEQLDRIRFDTKRNFEKWFVFGDEQIEHAHFPLSAAGEEQTAFFVDRDTARTGAGVGPPADDLAVSEVDSEHSTSP